MKRTGKVVFSIFKELERSSFPFSIRLLATVIYAYFSTKDSTHCRCITEIELISVENGRNHYHKSLSHRTLLNTLLIIFARHSWYQAPFLGRSVCFRKLLRMQSGQLHSSFATWCYIDRFSFYSKYFELHGSIKTTSGTVWSTFCYVTQQRKCPQGPLQWIVQHYFK